MKPFSSGNCPVVDYYFEHFYIFSSPIIYCMGSPIPRPVVAQAVVVILAAALFIGVLAIVGSVPTSDVPEHALRNANISAISGREDGFSAIITPMPDMDAMIAQPDMDVLSLPVNLSGNGSQTTESFNLVPGIASFDLWNDAPGNLEVWLIYNEERFYRLLGDGMIAENPVVEEIVTGGPYFLDVTADGEWRINVSQVDTE